MKRAMRALVILLCVGFSIASIVNVFGDNTEVEKLAKETACDAALAPPAKPGSTAKPAAAAPGLCSMSMTKMMRSPIAQSFEYTGQKSTHKIRCTRGFIFFGDYTCAVE